MNDINQDTIVIILGGGRGKRLFPLTKMRSKPAVPIGGKYRLIDIPISNCLHSGMDRLYILTQFNSASLNQHVARTYNFDSFTEGFVEVLAAEQTMGSTEWFQGTADAVRKIFPHILSKRWKYMLILSGDHLYRMNYAKYLKEHIDNQADLSVGVVGIPEQGASEFGLLKIDDDRNITQFQEKPEGDDLDKFRLDTTQFGFSKEEAKNTPFLGSMGIYIFNRECISDALLKNTSFNDFGKQVIPNCINSNMNVRAYPFQGYWEDIGTIRAFFEANLSLCGPKPPFRLFHPHRPIYTRQRHLAGSTVIDSKVSNCIINNGSLIKSSTLINSIIGLRTYIDEGVYVEGSLLMGADDYDHEDVSQDKRIGIGKNSRIINAIIDKNAHIGSNVVIENKENIQEFNDPEGRYYIRDGITIVVKGGNIPDNTVI